MEKKTGVKAKQAFKGRSGKNAFMVGGTSPRPKGKYKRGKREGGKQKGSTFSGPQGGREGNGEKVGGGKKCVTSHFWADSKKGGKGKK